MTDASRSLNAAEPADELEPLANHAPAPRDFRWSDAFLLGYGPMDSTHEEFVACVRRMLDAPDEEVPLALEAFEAHARRHFDEEREWMTSTGFPAAECHMDEHEQVMLSVQKVGEAIRAGEDVSIVRSLATELTRWFPGHADYMDAALSHWMVKRQHGGAPVVLRRKPA